MLFSGEIFQTATCILHVIERHVLKGGLCWEVFRKFTLPSLASKYSQCCYFFRQHGGNISDKFGYGDYALLGCDVM